MAFDRLRMSGMLRGGFDRLSLSALNRLTMNTGPAQPEPVEGRALTEGPGA